MISYKIEDDIELNATPILKGNDLLNLVESLKKKDTPQSKARRKSALSLLRKVSK